MMIVIVNEKTKIEEYQKTMPLGLDKIEGLNSEKKYIE